MFNKFKSRMNQQQPYGQMDIPQYNPYDFYRIDEQLNELRRVNAELTRRITRLENYLGIRSESEASNYQ